MSHTLVGALISLIDSTLDYGGITPSLLTQNLRYSVSAHTKNYIYFFTFNPASASFCGTFSRAFRWYENTCLVITIMLYIYERTVENPMKSSDIFYWKILELF